ncbi:MAG: TlpA family protein disulfide reductase, partial [Asgard group archaeon]|nr:TlpA family protein disulfide reductase [Asgard group archaeon]
MSDTGAKQKRSFKWLKISGIVLVSLVILGGIGYGTYYFTTYRNLDPAPTFTVSTLTGSNFTLTDHQGKVVLLDFMSRSCSDCGLLMDDLVEIYEEFNESLVILTLNVISTDNVTEFEEYIESYNATWDFAFSTNELSTAYAVTFVPRII